MNDQGLKNESEQKILKGYTTYPGGMETHKARLENEHTPRDYRKQLSRVLQKEERVVEAIRR